MDANLSNNTKSVCLDLLPNPDATLNCIGDLIAIACIALLDELEIEDPEYAKDVIFYVWDMALNYGLSPGENDVREVIIILYETVWDSYETIFDLVDEEFIGRVMSYVQRVMYEWSSIGCGEVLLKVWETLKEIPERRWQEIVTAKSWVYFYILDSPADLIVEDSNGNTTSVVQAAVTEGIENSFGIEFGGHKAVIVVGNDVYTAKVEGTGTGECGLSMFKPNPDDDLVAITYENLPTTDNSEATIVVSQETADYTLNLDNDGDGITDGTRSPDSISESIPFTTALNTGWNFISIPVHLADNAIDIALQSIAGQFNSVWRWVSDPTYPNGGYWALYDPESPIISDLRTLDPGNGYWIDMKNAALLTLNGQEASDERVMLNQGWNTAGYNGLTARPVEEVLSSIDGHFNSAWAWICDPTHAGGGYWSLYDPDSPLLSDLETLEPGMGLWIEAVNDCIWDTNGGTQPAPALRHRNTATRRRGDMLSSHRPEIPYIIWGSVEVDGAKMTSRGTASRTAMVFLKIDNEVQSSCQVRTGGRDRGFYRLEVFAATERRLKPATPEASAQAELHVQIDDTVMKAAPVPSGRPGQIIRVDLSIQLPPGVSLLHQNYPNPLNPDTWIPYQLRKDADVVIKIYTAAGQLVRILNLGHKPAGFYTSRERAAYWDGKNEAGEHVASGVYFYNMKAGDLTATSRMVIMK
jgi:hypothetical protein